ncbi:MAG TPA: hypothetical protein VIS74_07935, partial [Chthoniobacterales bacterium]
GFAGNIEPDNSQAKSGSGSARIDAELAGVEESGLAWKSISKVIDIPGRIEAVRFWVKSAEARAISVRLSDSTGQTHSVRPDLAPGDDWQEVIVTDFESGPGHLKYGGADDGKVHWPATSLTFVIEKGLLNDGRAIVWIDAIEILPGATP